MSKNQIAMYKRKYPKFNWVQYVSNYTDLQNAGINTETTALMHWAKRGIREKRTYTKLTDITQLTNKLYNCTNFALIFVCHDTETVLKCMRKYADAKIMFVGHKSLDVSSPNITIVRDLPDNIEHFALLLSFTAWYAIVKNNLYSEYDYLCIFEHDVDFKAKLLQDINTVIATHAPPVISFIRDDSGLNFQKGINNINNFKLFIDNYNIYSRWYSSTNHCIKRNILINFVDWYYPKCIDKLLIIDRHHTQNYHERLFSAYITMNYSEPYFITGLIHTQETTYNTVGYNLTDRIVEVAHNAGFFSCCNVRLQFIIEAFNKYKHIPYLVDSSKQFAWYKPHDTPNIDITDVFFKTLKENIKYTKDIKYHHEYQYILYNELDFTSINPFIKKYFSISDEIIDIYKAIVTKYNIDYSNTCVLFFRGNDKVTEVDLPKYEDYIIQAHKIKDKNPNIRFLIQSDDSEFLKYMTNKLDNTVIFTDEIRHIHNKAISVDKIDKSTNFEFIKKYLAITYIMSLCKYVVFGSGNCSFWIALYRGNANNIIQHCKGKWHSFD